MSEMLKKLQFKKDVRLIVFAIVLTIFTGVAIHQKWATPKEGLYFLGGALALPGLFGAAKKSADDADKKTDDEESPSG